jgi:carboxymethylenebutenolidase
MFKCIFVRCRVVLGLASLALFFAACDSGDSDSAEADKQAGRANVDAMTREHAGDTADPSEAAKIAPRRAVVSERLPYAEVRDELVYVGGKTATSPGVARQYMLNVVENPDPAVENMRQAIDFVNTTAGAPRIGSLGWCFGGGWSLNAAMLFPEELDASVIYYGQVTDDEDRLHAINAPILGFFGARDKGISVASVRRFETALERLRKNYEIHVYPGADHAFANPSGKAYNAEAADDAWQRTLEFLGRHLIEEGDEAS